MFGERCCRIGLTPLLCGLLQVTDSRQPSTGSVVITATCATTPLSQSTIKHVSFVSPKRVFLVPDNTLQ